MLLEIKIILLEIKILDLKYISYGHYGPQYKPPFIHTNPYIIFAAHSKSSVIVTFFLPLAKISLFKN